MADSELPPGFREIAVPPGFHDITAPAPTTTKATAQRPAADLPPGVLGNIPGALKETFGMGDRPGAVPLTGTAATKTPLGVLLKPQGPLEHATSIAVQAPLLGAAGAVAAPAKAIPLIGRAMPAAARVATAAGFGAAEQPAKPVRGALTGAATQALAGEVVAPIATRVAQRFGMRAFERLSDDLAEEIMRRAKALVPWWSELPKGQEGVRALVSDEGMRRLSERWNQQEARRAGFRIGRLTPEADAKTRETFREGINLINALRGLKAVNPSTGRVDPEALVEGLTKASGVKNPMTVWDRFLTERRAPGARKLIKAVEDAARAEGGAAPTTGKIDLPFFGVYGHHMRAGEGLPLLKYSRNIPTTELEQQARQVAPVIGGAVGEQFQDLAAAALLP